MQNQKLPARTSPITIMLSGGGSGGHITPLLSVAHEIKQINPAISTVYVGLRGDKIGESVQNSDDIDETYSVLAGKLRRYHGESLLRQMLDIRTQLLNARDAFYLLIGTWQAWRLLGRRKPDVIFAKGGFVVVPVAWAARLRKIPYGMHDSDTVAGLANRLIAKSAAWQATGMPSSFYSYPKATTHYTGVPYDARFRVISDDEKNELRRTMGITKSQPVVFVIGGGLGAQGLNTLAVEVLTSYRETNPNIHVFHVTGRANYAEVVKDYKGRGWAGESVRVIDYTDEVFKYSAASDVILTRAGATTLAEFAAQAKACIVIPSPHLSGGHQLSNASYFAEKRAVIVHQESDPPHNLLQNLGSLLKDTQLRVALAQELHVLAKPDAAISIAHLLINTASHRTA